MAGCPEGGEVRRGRWDRGFRRAGRARPGDRIGEGALPGRSVAGQRHAGVETGQGVKRCQRLGAVGRRRLGHDARAPATGVGVEGDDRVAGDKRAAVGEMQRAVPVGVARGGDGDRPPRDVELLAGLVSWGESLPLTQGAPMIVISVKILTNAGLVK